jgi:DNA invertase Pin-like site-specific DNA recombinase
VADLLNILQVLRGHGVDFISTTQAIDTTTSYGKMVMTFLGAIAEFERETIIERVKSGIQRAKEQGVRLGRPKAGVDVQRALALKQGGSSLREIAKELGVGCGTIYRALAAVTPVPKSP